MKKNSILFIALLSIALFATSCETDIFYIEGHGDIVSKTLDIDEFTGIKMDGAENVEISYGSTQEVVVTGHANIIDRIKTNVYSGRWDIELERGNYRNYDLKYYITVPQINEITSDGAAKVVINDFVNQGDLNISINGAGEIEINRMENTENMYISIDGAGHIKVRDEFPSLRYLDIYINGAGDYSGFPAISEECRIDIDGAAKCEVSVETQLDVFIDGAGVVQYKGYPSIDQHVSGLGVVQSMN